MLDSVPYGIDTNGHEMVAERLPGSRLLQPAVVCVVFSFLLLAIMFCCRRQMSLAVLKKVLYPLCSARSACSDRERHCDFYFFLVDMGVSPIPDLIILPNVR